MALFHSQNNKLDQVKEKPFVLEKEVQKLTEQNLENIFGLEFVASEFSLHGLRMDTLAFDSEKKSFVIIEYKRDQGYSVIDQGFAYLSLVMNNRADIVLFYNKMKKVSLAKDDFDWSQTRVVFVARTFTAHQQGAINFKDLPIELWEVARYTNDIILYNQIQSSTENSSINELGANKKIKTISKEVKNYTEEGYLSSRPDGAGKAIYQQLKEKIAIIDPSFVVHPTKTYIAFRMPNNWRNVIAFHLFKDKVRMDILRTEPSDFKDPERRVSYMKDSMKYFNQHISSIELESKKDIEYCVYIIQQAYDRFIRDNS